VDKLLFEQTESPSNLFREMIMIGCGSRTIYHLLDTYSTISVNRLDELSSKLATIESGYAFYYYENTIVFIFELFYSHRNAVAELEQLRHSKEERDNILQYYGNYIQQLKEQNPRLPNLPPMPPFQRANYPAQSPHDTHFPPSVQQTLTSPTQFGDQHHATGAHQGYSQSHSSGSSADGAGYYGNPGDSAGLSKHTSYAPHTSSSAPRSVPAFGDGLGGKQYDDIGQHHSAQFSDAARQRQEPASPNKWSSSPRVLLVDDDAVNRKLSARMLQASGISSDVAEDGENAVSKMNQGKYDLVLMVRAFRFCVMVNASYSV
jgi:hypothetical protein